MRFLVCGDIHCKPDILKQAVKSRPWDKFIFLGDACDNWGATQKDNLDTLQAVLDLKHEYGENFIWLLGNHDWGYYDKSIRMSGHIYENEDSVGRFLYQCIELWDIVYAKNGYIFSHAGLTWPALSGLSEVSVRELKHRPGKNNPLNNVGVACGGYSETPSPLWARPSEIIDIPLGNIQIVGHTPVKEINRWSDKLIVCDTFSQYPDGGFIGDKTLLYIEEDNIVAVDYETGEELYEV